MAEAKERSYNYGKESSRKEDFATLYQSVLDGFDAEKERADDIKGFWDMYNCILSNGQGYKGRSRLFAPFVHEAVTARVTRFVNQVFPSSSRHVEAVTEDGTIPRAAVALCEHYIADAELRSIIHSLAVSGDVEGQYNLYVSWEEGNRRTVRREEKPVKAGSAPVGKVKDVTEEDEPTGGPSVEVLSDADVLILPVTSASLDKALNTGGSVTILRRWNKRRIRQLIRDGEIDKKVGEELLESIDSYKDEKRVDVAKAAVKSAGVKKDGRGKHALVYEIWTELDIGEDGEYLLCQVYMAGKDKVLMARRNPYWCDRCPLLSAPVVKTFGSIKGRSQIAPVEPLQVFACDVLNQTADSAAYTLNPITLRDPAHCSSALVMAPGAIWDVPPNGASFAEMPEIWARGMEILSAIKAEIFQVLSVNPSMITQGSKKKLSQAEVAAEQQIDILTTSDATRSLVDSILDPLMTWFMDMDYQFRKNEVTIRAYGEMGMQAMMQKIPPFEMRKRVSFCWIGAEIAKNAAALQQKIAGLNILMQLPPQAMPHYKLNPEAIILDVVESVYGARIANQAVIDMRTVMSVPPEAENELMKMGHIIPVHMMDNPLEHIPMHQQFVDSGEDVFGTAASHIQEHRAQIMQMMQAQAGQMGQPGQPGQTPPGAQPGAPRPAQGPPGMLHQDRMSGAGDPTAMPRRM